MKISPDLLQKLAEAKAMGKTIRLAIECERTIEQYRRMTSS